MGVVRLKENGKLASRLLSTVRRVRKATAVCYRGRSNMFFRTLSMATSKSATSSPTAAASTTSTRRIPLCAGDARSRRRLAEIGAGGDIHAAGVMFAQLLVMPGERFADLGSGDSGLAAPEGAAERAVLERLGCRIC